MRLTIFNSEPQEDIVSLRLVPYKYAKSPDAIAVAAVDKNGDVIYNICIISPNGVFRCGYSDMRLPHGIDGRVQDIARGDLV